MFYFSLIFCFSLWFPLGVRINQPWGNMGKHFSASTVGHDGIRWYSAAGEWHSETGGGIQ
jgi:hypothetical protein